jgi:transketolase
MFMQTLLDNAKADKDIMFITGDLGYGVVEEFQKEIPNQFINAGVSEQAMMGMAAGIASTGKRVFVYSIGNFPTLRCLEQIRNDVCLMNNPVVVVSVGAGYSYGSQGYTHHALEDIAVMRALPNMNVYVPCDSIESKAITNFLCKDKSPSYLRLGKSGEPILHSSELTINNNKIIELQNGTDGLILFVGPIGNQVLSAAKDLENIGINVSVASAPVVSNLDEDYLIKSAQSGPIVTVEEHSFRGGFGSAVLEKLNSLGISYQLKIVASKQNNLSEIGSQAYLQKANGLDHESIKEAFLSLRANQKK